MMLTHTNFKSTSITNNIGYTIGVGYANTVNKLNEVYVIFS